MAKRSAKFAAIYPCVSGDESRFPDSPQSCAHTAELTVLAPQAHRPALAVSPQFERSSGNQVPISYSSNSALVTKIQDGKMADLAILDPKQIKALQDEGKIVEDKAVAPIAKLAFGVIIREGTTKPDSGHSSRTETGVDRRKIDSLR